MLGHRDQADKAGAHAPVTSDLIGRRASDPIGCLHRDPLTRPLTGTVTRRQELTYFDSRRLEKIINPVNTAKWTGLVYEDRGLLSELAAKDGSTDLNKTQWTYDCTAHRERERLSAA